MGTAGVIVARTDWVQDFLWFGFPLERKKIKPRPFPYLKAHTHQTPSSAALIIQYDVWQERDIIPEDSERCSCIF